MSKLSTSDRIRKAFRGPWGASDGPVANGRNYGANGRRLSDEPMTTGMSLVTFDQDGNAAVDTLYPDLDDLPTQGAGGYAKVYAAGRMSVTRAGGMKL